MFEDTMRLNLNSIHERMDNIEHQIRNTNRTLARQVDQPVPPKKVEVMSYGTLAVYYTASDPTFPQGPGHSSFVTAPWFPGENRIDLPPLSAANYNVLWWHNGANHCTITHDGCESRCALQRVVGSDDLYEILLAPNMSGYTCRYLRVAQ